jgi:hypothetical protein
MKFDLLRGTAMLVAVAALVLAATSPALAQSCLAAGDMDPIVRSSLESAAQRYFDMAAKGDVFSLKQNAIPSLASNFTAIETAVVDNRPNFEGAHATVRPPFLLKADGTQPIAHAEFLCGVFNAQGQTRDSAVFVINNLAPGTYAVVIVDAHGAKGPYTLSLVLQQVGTDWKLGGFYAKAAEIAGHDAVWFMDRARQYRSKGQNRVAWLYFLQARDLIVPVPFMSTMMTDKLYDEIQAVKPADFPVDGKKVPLVTAVGPPQGNIVQHQQPQQGTEQYTGAQAKTVMLTSIFPLAVGDELDLVVKYESPDVSNTTRTFQDNVAVIKGLVAKYPELRDAFTGVVARAVEPSGRDYGTLLAMKDIK